MSVKITHEMFMERLSTSNSKFIKGEFEVLGTYKTRCSPILLKDKYGECFVKPDYLLSDNSGTSINTAINKEEYLINQFKDKRNVLYDYSKIKYVNQKTPMEIVCKDHGSFWQTPDVHKKGHGCTKCHVENNVLIGRETLLERLSEIKGGCLYDVRKDYRVLQDYIGITCSLNHTYEQKAIDHLNGNGCPVCADIRNALFFEGSKDNDDIYKIRHYVYFLKMYKGSEVFYKIGVSKNIKKRIGYLKKDAPYEVEVLGQEEYSILTCYDLERFIKEEFKPYAYIPEMHFGGYTECFDIDIYDKYLDLMHNHYNNLNNEQEIPEYQY